MTAMKQPEKNNSKQKLEEKSFNRDVSKKIKRYFGLYDGFDLVKSII